MDKNKAKEVMKFNKVEKLYHTSDGMFFIEKNSAQNHAIKEHGAKREKALKVEIVTASSLGLEGAKKSKDTSKITKEELQKQYDELFEKYENAEASVKEKGIAFNTAKQEAAKAKGTDKEAEMSELEKKSGAVLKSATTKKDNLFVALEELEAKLED